MLVEFEEVVDDFSIAVIKSLFYSIVKYHLNGDHFFCKLTSVFSKMTNLHDQQEA